MNAFDMISEPILFMQELREYSSRVHQSAELILSLADALLAEDYAKTHTLHEQMSGTWHEVNQSKLSLYRQIRGMHFHVAGGDVFDQYMACLGHIFDSLQGLADLLASHKTPFPSELHDDFRALVAGVVHTGKRTMSLGERLLSEAEAVYTDAETQSTLDAVCGTINGKGGTRQREMEFTRHLHSVEKQLDPVAVSFLNKCRTVLHEVANNAERAADDLRQMIP